MNIVFTYSSVQLKIRTRWLTDFFSFCAGIFCLWGSRKSWWSHKSSSNFLKESRPMITKKKVEAFEQDEQWHIPNLVLRYNSDTFITRVREKFKWQMSEHVRLWPAKDIRTRHTPSSMTFTPEWSALRHSPFLLTAGEVLLLSRKLC
jgi:hypothetical protein